MSTYQALILELLIKIKSRFGKILGMSTRKGSMVTVDELLKEAKAVMVESQLKSRNTRVEGVEVHIITR